MVLSRLLLWLLSYIPPRFVPSGMGWMASQEILSPTESRSESTVILGAGIIGLSTAYYLAVALNETTSPSSSYLQIPIVVIEPSHDMCPGASGQATGGLGDFGFGTETSPLGSLSYSLHKELASKYGGREKYGFSDLGIFRVSPRSFTGTPSPPDSWGPWPPVEKNISNLPDWIKPSEEWTVQSLADAPHAAHLDPLRFCQFLRERCEELGVRFLFNSMATSLERDDARQSFARVIVETKSPKPVTKTIPCNAVVIAAGPWSSRVFSQLVPAARFKLRLNNTWSAGNHALIRNPLWRPSADEKGSIQVFLNNVIPGPNRLDITSFLGGTLYVGGWGAKPEHLPEDADAVQAQPGEIKAMLELARQYIRLKPGETVEVLNTGRCYRPLAVPNKPIITKVKWSLLGHSGPQVKVSRDNPSCPHSPVIGGLYINTGHNSDGVTLGPGSGKLMSDLLLGRTPSVPLSGFGLNHDENPLQPHL